MPARVRRSQLTRNLGKIIEYRFGEEALSFSSNFSALTTSN
ncbi:hypothetical protein SOVF_178650 [Spinacia oleracea]|nr:hypothetical protein SOVF_178650 [Spinacia oleracea]